MKRTRFFSMLSLIGGLLLVTNAVFAQPGSGRDGNFPDFSYTASPTRIVELNVVQQLINTPEFSELFDALTARIDEEYVKASNQPNFPTPAADLILDKVREAKGKTAISSKDVIELFFSQVELIQIEAFIKKAYDAGDIGPTAKEKSGEYARLTFVTKFSPSELAGLLDMVRNIVTVDTIKGEKDDFLVSVYDPSKEDKLYLGGRKIEDLDNYVIVFGLRRDLVEQKLDRMQNERGRRFLFGENAPAKSLRIGKGVFEVAEIETQKKVDAGNTKEKDMLRILKQVNSLIVVTRDFDGKTGTQLRLVLNGEDAASDLKDIANGGKAFLRFIIGSDGIDANARQLINQLLDSEIEQNEQTLSVTINWSNDQFVQLAKDAFKKIAADIKK